MDDTVVDEFKAWTSDVKARRFNITVSEPETTESFLSSYTTYKVSTSPNNWVVRRRFSDFSWLMELLEHRYVGALVPGLPEKRTIGNTGAVFVRERMRGLSLFLDDVAANPFLRQDSAVAQFLSEQDPKEWDRIKDSTTPLAKDSENVGHERWQDFLSRFTLPENADSVVADIQRQLEAIEPVFRELAASTKRLAEKSSAFSAELGQFSSLFHELRTAEQATTTETVADTPTGAVLASFPPVLEKVSMGVSAWSKIAEFQPQLVEGMLQARLAFETRQIGRMREVLRNRAEMLTAKRKAEKTLDKHTAELYAVKGRNPAKEAARARQVEESRVTCERAAFVVDMISKALLLSELERLTQQKVDLVRTIFGMYAFSGQKLAQKQTALWQTMSAQMAVPREVAETEAKRAMAFYSTTASSAPSESTAGAGSGAGAGAAKS